MYIVAIAGGSGSGKTTFAHKILEELPRDEIVILSMDSYYLTHQPLECQTSKGNLNFDHPRAFDWDLLRQHIKQLKANEVVEGPKYCFKSHKRLEERQRIEPRKILIFEGIFSLFDQKIRELSDLKCFLSVDSDIRFTRRLHRDIQDRGRSLNSVMDQYYETVRPMYQKYLEPQKQYADLAIGEETDKAAKVVASHLSVILNNHLHEENSSHI